MKSALWVICERVADACAAARDPRPARVFVQPGAEVAWDEDCGDGQLAVRVIQDEVLYSSNVNANGQPCALLGNRATLGISLVRCVSGLDDQGNPPTPFDLNLDSSVILEDQRALWQVLACLDVPHTEAARVLTWSPLGPMGRYAGGEWQLSVTYTPRMIED